MPNHDDPTKIVKALIIADPWIDLILNGSKTWEMRSRITSHRGWFGLIRKGTGEVCGIARLIASGPRLNSQEMADSAAKHRIPKGTVGGNHTLGWNVPWKLADAMKLSPPVPYHHRSGAVTWVVLDEAATVRIAQQIESSVPLPVGESQAAVPTLPPIKAPASPTGGSRPRTGGSVPSEATSVMARPRSAASRTFSGTESVLRDDGSVTCVKETVKMSIWRSSSGEVFAVERPHGEIFVVDGSDIGDLPLVSEPYPASELNQVLNGKQRYGRHSGLKSIPELREADLVRFLPNRNDEVRLLLAALRARR